MNNIKSGGGSASYREMSGSTNLVSDINKNGKPIKKG
jgi:hypothetical protein